MYDFSIKTKEIEGLISQGKGALAREKLLSLLTNKNQGQEKSLLLARLARRLTQPLLVIKILLPWIKEYREGAKVSDGILAEYGIALSRLGARREAGNLLRNIPMNAYPEINLLRAFFFFGEWDFSQALPFILDYGKQKFVTPQAEAVARVNYCACLVGLKNFDEALKEIEQLKSFCQKHHLLNLLGNCFEIETQIYYRSQLWNKAMNSIQTSIQILERSAALDFLFAKKWESLILLKTRGDVQYWNQVFALAKSWPHPETLRAMEYEKGVILEDESLILKVYAGTPHPKYREKIQISSSLKNKGDIILGEGNSASLVSYDESCLKLGIDRLPSRLFALLLRDLYQPSTVAQLAEFLFEGEYFNPLTTPKKVHQVFFRLRSEIENQKLPFHILQNKGKFSVDLENLALLFPLDRTKYEEKHQYQVHEIRKFFGDLHFRRSEVQEKTLWDQEYTIRLLRKLTEEGILEKRGGSRSTYYRFPLLPPG